MVEPQTRSRQSFGVWIGILIGIGVTLLVLLLVALFSFILMGRCPMCEWMMGRPVREPMMRDGMPDWMMGGRRDRTMRRDMRVIHFLLVNHEQIDREVEDIPGGVQTVTTSDDPDVAEAIRRHVRQMQERLEENRPIRHMDPVFKELFRHHGKIEMEVDDVPGGVRVVETSDDPQVKLLIRQHAHRAVSEFVEDGMQRAMQPTPLPEGYQAQNPDQEP